MKIKLTLTEEHLRLISCIRFKKFPEDYQNPDYERVTWAIDLNNLYGGSFLYEDMSFILGIYDKHIEGTEEDPLGVRFPEELEAHMLDLHMFLIENLESIEEIVHQFSIKGGVTPGTYSCNSTQRIWEKDK